MVTRRSKLQIFKPWIGRLCLVVIIFSFPIPLVYWYFHPWLTFFDIILQFWWLNCIEVIPLIGMIWGLDVEI